MYNLALDPCRICISGRASQNLQTFTEPSNTQTIWMVASCYYLARPIFEDSGFRGRIRAVPKDAEGTNIDYLSRALLEMDSGNLNLAHAGDATGVTPTRTLALERLAHSRGILGTQLTARRDTKTPKQARYIGM